MSQDNLQYAGFWVRVAAALVDTVMLMLIAAPFMLAIYGKGFYFGESSGGIFSGFWDLFFNLLLPIGVTIAMWVRFGATPGKFMINAKVVDAATGVPPTVGQAAIRYLGYFVSVIPLGLGIFWVAFDAKKRGWHDLLANTVVVRSKDSVQAVSFNGN